MEIQETESRPHPLWYPFGHWQRASNSACSVFFILRRIIGPLNGASKLLPDFYLLSSRLPAGCPYLLTVQHPRGLTHHFNGIKQRMHSILKAHTPFYWNQITLHTQENRGRHGMPEALKGAFCNSAISGKGGQRGIYHTPTFDND